MGIGDLVYVVFAVGVFHAVAIGVYYVGVRRTPGWWADPRVRALTRRTLLVSVGYPLFVAAWAVYGVLLGCLLVVSHRRACRLRAAGV